MTLSRSCRPCFTWPVRRRASSATTSTMSRATWLRRTTFGQIEAWCHEHKVASSGHMLLEESLLFHVMFSGSMMKNWARMDLPGVDLLGALPYKTMAGWERGRFPVVEDCSCKMASSVAHLTGKQGVFTESFALARKVPLRSILGVAAWQFSGGITHMSTYTIQEQLSAEDYACFSDFVGRLAVLARRGRHVADVAVMVPEGSVWASYTPPNRGRYEGYFACNPEPLAIDRVFRETCNNLSSHQRDFDCLSEGLLRQARVDDGRLLLADEEFRVFVLPEVRMLSRASLEKVRAFLRSGGRVAFVGSLPCQSPDRGADPQMTGEVKELLGEFPERTVRLADEGQRSELATWIERQVPAEVRWEGASAVRILRREEGGRCILLVANPSGQDVSGKLTVPVAGEASVWDPETGEVRANGVVGVGQAVSLKVPARSARCVVVSQGKKAVTRERVVVAKQTATPFAIGSGTRHFARDSGADRLRYPSTLAQKGWRRSPRVRTSSRRVSRSGWAKRSREVRFLLSDALRPPVS